MVKMLTYHLFTSSDFTTFFLFKEMNAFLSLSYFFDYPGSNSYRNAHNL